MGRKLSNILIAVATGLLGLAALAPTAFAAPTIATSFNPNLGELVSIAWDPGGSTNLVLYNSFGSTIKEYTTAGTAVDRQIAFPGTTGNDFDMDFTTSGFTLPGRQATIPAYSILAVNGDDGVDTIYLLSRTDGKILATIPLQSNSSGSVGIAHLHARGTFYVADYTLDELLEIDPNSGNVVGKYPIAPAGSPAFDIFYGDVDVHPTSGNLFVVSSSQAVVRELTPTGAFVKDYNLEALALEGGMSGLAFDSAGDAWISTTAGFVYKITDLLSGGSEPPPPECSETDSICTGDEDDEVDGTSSGDFIYTADGDDSISSGGGNDVVEAGAGNDGIAAGAGADHVEGGSGDDTILGDSNAPTWARLAAGSSGDVLEGQDGEDTISGEAGGDELDGGTDADALSGGAGGDTLKAGSGKDTLKGGSGFDLLNGGPGTDTCVVDSKKEQRRAKSCERFRRHL